MAKPTPSRTRPDTEDARLSDTDLRRLLDGFIELADLRRRVELLEAKWDALRTEVRTRRLVVEAPNGQDAIWTEAGDRAVSLNVASPRPANGDSQSIAKLFATWDEVDADVEHFGVCLIGAGNIVGALDAIEDQDAEPADRWGRLGKAFRVALQLEQPNSNAGMVVDHEGMRLAPMRRHMERQAYLARVPKGQP